MRVTLVVQRDPSTEATWVTDAIDEWSLEEWNGRLPDDMQKKIDADPANFRLLHVQVPDDALDKPFEIPVVTGRVEKI